MTENQQHSYSSSLLTLPLVAAQPGIWMAEQLAASAGAFNVAHYVEFYGEPDCALFAEAISHGLAAADMVHARFGENAAGEPQQYLRRHVTVDDVPAPQLLDFTDDADGEARALAWMRADIVRPPSLSGGAPLWRQALMRVAAGKTARWFWYQRFHHLQLDGFSFTALTRWIVTVYQALRRGEPPPPSPFTSFAAVAAEYATLQTSPAWQQSREFWRAHAAQLPAPLSLALAEEMNAADSALPLQQSCSLSGIDMAGAARTVGREAVELLMAGICLYFSRMSGEPRLSIGFPFMRRMGSQALTALGPVVNVLPLQLEVSAHTSLNEAAAALAQELKTVRRHQRYEAEQLRRDLQLVSGEGALYGPVLNYKLYHEELCIDGQPAITHPLAMGPVDDLEIEIAQHQDALQLRLIASPRRYSAETLRQHAGRITHLLQQLFAAPQKAVGDCTLMMAGEAQRIAVWSTGARIAPQAQQTSLLDWLARRVTQDAHQVAVISGQQRLSWRQLHDNSMRLARELIARGIGAEDAVAIALPRSELSVVAIFGVLASGAACLPLDLDYPPERLALMCDDARPALILTVSDAVARLPTHLPLCELDAPDMQSLLARHACGWITDAERREPLQGEHLAYIIYTSGSTGKPKGVMNSHQGLLNLLTSHAAQLFGPAIVAFNAMQPRRICAGHTASFSFDSSWEPLFCMLMGAELLIFDEETRRDAWAVVQQMRHTPVDIMDVTPSFLLQMIDAGLLEPGQPAPQLLMIGGEAATPRLWEIMRAHPQIAFHNYYGPSEYAIDTLGAAVSEVSQPAIGRPVANTDVWLLDERLQPVPIGVAGELYISGPGIARGYLRRPELTAARFVANPFRTGEVMYRTGDLLRWRADGQLAFIGRLDDQIKIRGFRVELGEVESALASLTQVSGAAVVAQPQGASWRLVGYCAVADEQLRRRANLASELQSALAQRLPDYMVPTVLMVLEALPLTVNGKVDRRALPDPGEIARPPGRQASTPQERLICQAMAQVLGLAAVGADDDFFVLGGDSISAMSLGNRLRHAGWQLRPKEIFAGRTPAAMARLMASLDAVPTPVAQRSGVVDSLPILRWYHAQGQHLFAHGVWLNTPATLTLRRLNSIMAALTQAHPALRARLSGADLLIDGEGHFQAQCHVQRVEEPMTNAAERAFHFAVAQLDAQAGRLWNAVLLERNGQAVGLVLVIHHLVTDGVSWRVLLETLPAAAEKAALETGGHSLVDWSRWLAQHGERYRAELPFWREMLATPCSWPGVGPLDARLDTQATRGEIRTLLSPAHSAALSGALPSAWRTRTDVLLLAALLIAWRACTGQRGLRVNLESHGRADEIDLSRCVGWLTAEYPLWLSLRDEGEEALNAVRAVKAVTEAVNDYGVGYGVLRWLLPDAPLRELAQRHPAPVLFNYLGRLAQAGSESWTPHAATGLFRDGLAVYSSPQMPLSHPLEINIFAGQGETPQLAIHWGFARRWLQEEAVVALARAFSDALEQLVTFARQAPRRAQDTLVAAQTGIAGLTEADVEALRRQHGAPGEILPLLPLQQGLLFHVRSQQTAGCYNSLTRLTLRGALTEARLSRALNQLVARYPQLAARFDSELAPQPVQILPLAGDARLCWPLTSCQLSPDEAEEAALSWHEREELKRPLLAGRGPLLHARWLRHADAQRHTLFLTAHHLVVDGWSTPVVVGDLLALLNDETVRLPTPPVAYGALVRQLAARDAGACAAAWAERMAGVSPTLLFGEQPDSGPVTTLSHTLSPAQEQAVRQFCHRHGLTLNTVMQGIWGMLLSIMSGSDEVVFGSPVSGRTGADALDRQVGLFSNTLPVRVTLDMTRPAAPQLQALQQSQIALLEHDNISLADIQRQAGVGTLFDTLLVVENYPAPHQPAPEPGALRCEAITNRGYTHYPLTLLVLPGAGISLHLESRPALRDPRAWLDRFARLLMQLTAQPDVPLWRWSLLSKQERDFLQQINRTAHPLAPETLYQAIQRQCAATPDALALLDSEQQLTWRQMHDQVCALAQRLQEAGVTMGDVVAVALPRSVRLSLALQAIVALGAAWLPLDVGYPDERLRLMLEDAAPRLVIAGSEQATRFAAVARCLRFDALAHGAARVPRLPDVDAQQAAYLLYTSGSTGRPKGVLVSHEVIINRLRWMQAAFPLGEQDVVLQKTACSFDVSVWEFFWPLMAGARLVMAPPEAHRDPQALLQLIEDYHVTTLHFVPSMLASWLDALMLQPEAAARCATLRQVFCSGEALSGELARRFRRLLAAPLHNLYGPTEAAVDVSWQPADAATLATLNACGVPIGRPVWNSRLYILDRWLRPLPPGAPGELWLSGVQLAHGYLKRPDLTASRFVADPFAPGERMYRTGDIARWRADGVVEYLGRSDDQLKIRGQRIELGEIEQALLSLPGIAQAAVAPRQLSRGAAERDNRQLVAWLIASDERAPDEQRLRLALAACLPAHMVPARYLFVKQFPLGPSGKLDRKALPLPERLASQGEAPASASERQVAALFSQLLGVKKVCAEDDFFTLGGHSLLAMQLALNLRRRFDRPVAIGQVMAARTVRQLAALMDGEQAAAQSGTDELLTLRDGTGPTLFCFHPASGFAWQYSGLLRYLQGAYPVVGLQSPRPTGAIATAADIDAACERQLANLRQRQPHGPYYLLGYSLGGTLAHGVAARLAQQGEQVAFLGLLDTWPPEGQEWSGPDEEQAREEVAREQAEFMADAQQENDAHMLAEKQALFSAVVANYQDAVRLLSRASTGYYPGKATLLVATRTLPPGMDARKTWAPYVAGLDIYLQDCEHADILSPQTLVKLGPLLNQLIQPSDAQANRGGVGDMTPLRQEDAAAAAQREGDE
ncbi:non-ribosomal peptide synthetase [Mixta tenebrionis]|uniref:Amino acid adenylation domain-containing protein n=1 Tax=Mixta tenebrionis TaxID=2562439 RepID=A0A506VBC3_9GAMM|nr:non-ribosomal peptide synthetase [Mixta tenebrionis]TPW42858.1 amino acid adenylation domain-containing protein [Mixta tenebrionis]